MASLADVASAAPTNAGASARRRFITARVLSYTALIVAVIRCCSRSTG